GLAAEELLLPQAQSGAELFVLGPEEALALLGAVVHGLAVTGLPPGLELLGQAWADGAGAVRDGGCRAGRVRRRGGQGNSRRARAAGVRKRSGHDDRCSPEPS